MSIFVSLVLEHGELPESVDGGPSIAKALASCMDELDSIARGLGLKPLVDFEVEYEEELDEILSDESIDLEEAMVGGLGSSGPWYDSNEALQTVRGLIKHIPESDRKMIVLRSLETELVYASEQGSGFHLHFSE